MEKDIQKLTENERYYLRRKQLKEKWNKITQEERLDLTDIKEETEAYTKSFMDALKDKEIEKGDRDYILKANCDLMAENKRLKKQLKDYERILKEYAESDNWDLKTLQIDEVKYGWKPALKTLKKWEDK